MIAQTTIKMQKQQWQIDLASAFTTLDKLLNHCNIEESQLNISHEAAKQFRLFVTKSWADRIEKGNINDPLLRQVLPVTDELEAKPGYNIDPLDEKKQSPVAGLIHKYNGRALVTLAGQCAINCRYCFRRNFPYSSNQFNKKNWEAILEYLKDTPSIYEVILSGGDPLILPDKILHQVNQDLSNIPSIKYLRVHSRIPIALPSRITPDMINIFTVTKLKTTFVVHTNCAQEINTEVAASLKKLRKAGIHLLNQSVLLAGINDNHEALVELSHKLFECGASPYYLHRLDKVLGSSHFYINKEKEADIYKKLLATLPGYLVPKLVTEVPYAKAKVPISVVM